MTRVRIPWVLSLGRLENKENAYYTDPAVVGYYFEYLDGVNAGTLPFDVMVENQGNTWLSNLSLHVNYLGKNKVFRIDNLPPGELRVEKLYLQGAEINESVEIDAQLHLPAGLKDNRIENNQKDECDQISPRGVIEESTLRCVSLLRRKTNNFPFDFPRMTLALMTTSTGSSKAGRSYITSSMADSMIGRSARAPVFMVSAISR